MAVIEDAPVTPAGAASQPLEPFDREMEQYMRQRAIPGGALAVARGGRLLYARGYGWADPERRRRVRPTSLFRIASISKPITAVAVLKLVEEGRLFLGDRAFDRLSLTPVLKAGDTPDPRLRRITVRQLLQHTAGWDRGASFDPMFRPLEIAAAVGAPAPADAEAVIRFMLGRPLDFDPGTRYAYSNFGYNVLGRVIEAVTGQPYEQYVRRHVLAPLGITRMRIGRSLEGQAARGEVRYLMPTGRTARSVFPGVAGPLPAPYGTFHLEAMDSHGGWIASAVDLVRFAAGLTPDSTRPLLRGESRAMMLAPPPAPVARKEDGTLAETYYGLGWQVRPVGGERVNYWHNGALPGTYTILVQRADGLCWAALFNQRPEAPQPAEGEIDGALHRAAAAVREWPEGTPLFD